ncbi:hypothetical protein TNCV_449761 [Trichonephila clavipes]|nr:hypothetical protein TNCV_449761 [Trichonephila clavipes]
MISHTCSNGDRSGDAGQGNLPTLCRARCVTTVVQCVWATDSLVAGIHLAFSKPTQGHHWHKSRTCFDQKTQQISTSSSNELFKCCKNGNGLESVEYMLQGYWFGSVLEVTDL